MSDAPFAVLKPEDSVYSFMIQKFEGDKHLYATLVEEELAQIKA